MADDPDRRHDASSDKNVGHPHPFDRHTLVWLLFFFVLYYMISMLSEPSRQSLSYSDFKSELQNDNVASVTFRQDQILGSLRTADPGEEQFITVRPDVPDEELLPILQEQEVSISAESSRQPAWLQVLLAIAPWLLLIAFFLYFSRLAQRRMGMGGGKEGMFGFSRSKARLFEISENQVSYDDVAGADSAKQELLEIIDFLKEPERFRKIGAKMPKGILLMGPPGTGKTLLAKATAHEAGVPFFSISGSEFIEMFVGVGASRVRDMFQEARKRAPALIFIDEIDSVGRVRGTGVGGGNDEREQTLNQVLAEMDGFSADEAVVVLAATNRPDVLDQALLRPGRFDRKVTLELPQQSARREILKVHLRKVPLQDDVEVDELARMTVGFSGADLANLVNEAALLAARRQSEQVGRQDFTGAHDRIVMGSERRDLLNPTERRRTAIHESGHAIAALMSPEADPVHQITIIPRGRALGVTEQLPTEDRYNYTEDYLTTRLTVLMGGRCAEQLVLGETSSGAGSDLEQATRLARMMVAQWGMSEALGPVHFSLGDEHPFLGYELTQTRDYSEASARQIDEEVKRIVAGAEQRCRDLLTVHRDSLDRLVEALLERETLDRRAIDQLLGTAAAETEEGTA